MSSRRSMTRDIHESIRLVLGKNVKILLKAPVKLELKGGDKTENRILVFTAHRLFVMTAKVPTKIETHIHYLDLRLLESKRSNHIAFTFMTNGDKTSTLKFRPNEDTSPNPENAVDEMLVVLISAVKRIFPNVPLENVIGKVNLKPADSRLVNHTVWKDPDAKLIGPCGGFSVQYACMCDYYSLPFREEVAWDVDTIYFSHDSHEFNLQDFDHLDHRDLLCVVSSLEHNTWFTKLKASTSINKMSSDLCDKILQVIAKSISLQELHMSAIGVRWEFGAKLGQAMAANPKSALSSFDLSGNLIEDKGINFLSTTIAKHNRGLKHVNISFCSISSKGLLGFANALSSNKLNLSTLTYLNLSGNTLKDEAQALCTFLAQPNFVAILDISSTETPLDSIFGALVRGCTTSLTHLNLSRNPFSSKKAKEIPAAFKQFFATTLALQYLNISQCKIPPEGLKHLLLGLACNEVTSNVELNLSCNNLSAAGATVLESCMGGVKCVTRLDLSENAIDNEMSGVMQGMIRNKSVLSLNVSRNMLGVKPKHLPTVMENIVQLIQDEETILQKLNLSDCKLKGELNNVINALGSNQSLQHLDITGNMMGDTGARLLAKALQINTRLRIINLDRNGITLQGLTEITYALQSNYAMRHIPFPTFDLQPMVKTHPDRVDQVIHRLQELLQRNASPHRFRNTAQAFRLTQGFLLSSTQQILDRVAAQTQDNIDALLKLNPERSGQEDVTQAKGLIQDAENCKHLLSALHEVTSRGTEVDLKLKQTSLDLSNFVASHVQQNVDAMLGCAEKQCPTVMASPSKSDLRTACQKKCQIPTDFVSSLIMDQLGLEIHNKINELNLIIANHISDRVIDEVIEGLGAKSKSIVTEAGSLRKQRSLTPDVLKGRSSSLSESLEHQETVSTASTDAISQKSESSPLGTPQTSKRKSLHGRKLRPKSSADGKGDATSLNNEESDASEAKTEDTVPELPSSAVLQHLGKARPKRAKTRAPSRGAIVTPSPGANDSMDDEGIQRFYSSSANSSFSPGSTPSGSPIVEIKDDPTTPSLDKKTIPKRATSPDVKSDLKSPLPKPAARTTLSCLASTSASADEDKKTESPEKRSLSPSLHSLSDLFSKKSAELKQASPKPEVKGQSTVSPFATRKTDSELVTSKKLSEDDKGEQEARTFSPEPDGKRTPEGVIKRHGVGHGGNPILMAEIKEKRASMVTKAATEGDLSPSKPASGADPAKNVFGHVKLRSTGLAGNLASPTSDFGLTKTSGEDREEESKGGSIVGLRAFTASTSASSTSASPKATTDASAVSPASAPKPKPLPKPRPWSIVGVDRKSGEVTAVGAGSEASSPSATEASGDSRKSSVRDLINNMNKAGSTTTNVTDASVTPADSGSRRKGNSLPRGVNPSTVTSGGDTSEASRSPNVTKRSDSTNDDPRILKLEDDFAYDDVLDV